MKFFLCLALCFAAAQAGLVGVQNAFAYSSPYSTYSAPYTTYSAAVAPAPALYNAPLAYSAYPSVYSAGLNAPTVYSTAGLGVASPLVRSAYAAPTVYSAAPSVYSAAPVLANTLLKK
ncbi:cuticle protein 16.5-like [Eupeodes corollae]|uniref:cuticle protein 16.5-like n=1 Tax=Eupeodes corollae TaxID=290404 RepID=UPI00248F8A26|nr:cuticle protein 16.5-like [Eupeodes corollae]